jgi:DNA-binding transcriptional MerR regulator
LTAPNSKLRELLSVAEVAARARVSRFRVQRIADSGAIGTVIRVAGARLFTEAQAQMMVELIPLTELGYSVARAAALLQARATGRLSLAELQSDGREALERAERAASQAFVYARLVMDARAEGEVDGTS